jgi:hypothetical protein
MVGLSCVSANTQLKHAIQAVASRRLRSVLGMFAAFIMQNRMR